VSTGRKRVGGVEMAQESRYSKDFRTLSKVVDENGEKEKDVRGWLQKDGSVSIGKYGITGYGKRNLFQRGRRGLIFY